MTPKTWALWEKKNVFMWSISKRLSQQPAHTKLHWSEYYLSNNFKRSQQTNLILHFAIWTTNYHYWKWMVQGHKQTDSLKLSVVMKGPFYSENSALRLWHVYVITSMQHCGVLLHIHDLTSMAVYIEYRAWKSNYILHKMTDFIPYSCRDLS